MAYKVIKRFKDKYTGAQYCLGDTFISDEAARIEDLLNRKLIEPIETPVKKKTNRSPKSEGGD